MLAFDCRAHGKTTPLGAPEKVGFDSFADDLCHFLDHLDIARAVVGGISMGAGVAANVALRYPGRVSGLVLSRPAWLEGPNLENSAPFCLIAALLRRYGPDEGKRLFEASEFYRESVEKAPDAAKSLLGQFDSPLAAERAIRLERMPLDAPYESLQRLESITVPAIVLANRQDPVHPYSFGEAIARAIPGAVFREITAKSVDPVAHGDDVNSVLSTFLQQNFLQGSP